MSRMLRMSQWKVWQDGREPAHVGPQVITPMMRIMVDHLKGHRGNTVVADNFGIKLLASDMARLGGTRWFNDQVINFYLEVHIFVYNLHFLRSQTCCV